MRCSLKESENQTRGVLPDAFIDGSPSLMKVCHKLRLTNEIRIMTFIARQHGEILIIYVRAYCELSNDLREFASENRILIRRR